MSCCADPRAQIAAVGTLPAETAALVTTEGRNNALTLYVPEIHCAACISRIEERVRTAAPGVTARVNFTRKTATLTWERPDSDPAEAIGAMRSLGYAPQPLATGSKTADPAGRELIRALAVAGFAAMNVMLLSVSVWAGADGTTARFLNWFAALIALPALAYSARPFVRSAVRALAARSINMDVPIALAIVLAAGLSLFHTLTDAGETYFDAAITLTFFLLAGRVLDHMTREKARSAVRHLASIAPATAHVFAPDGSTHPVSVAEIRPGEELHVAAGERVPVDARLAADAAFDLSLATGESHPVHLAAGEEVLAGALALTGPIRVTALRPAAASFLATVESLQRAAEEARSRPARIADRAAKVYAPAVHLVALFTFISWLVAGAGVHAALVTAIAVLIITCPCALGLAVPAVQVAACERLFRRGLLIKDGGALERMRAITEVVFDKTGTLTTPELAAPGAVPDATLAVAAALARHSTHPMARAVQRAAEARGLPLPLIDDIREERGRGIAGRLRGAPVSLGASAQSAGLAVTIGNAAPVALPVRERLREGAATLVRAFEGKGLPVTILSGDKPAAVEAVATRLGIADWRAGCSAADKTRYLDERRAAGARVLMVGDGLNDGPALSAAHASIAPADASDLSRTAADLVITGDDLSVAAEALSTARAAHRLILQNFAIAAGYNMIAIPLAILGHASPLAAAIAMSTSSILVTFNALRLTAGGTDRAVSADAGEPQGALAA